VPAHTSCGAPSEDGDEHPYPPGSRQALHPALVDWYQQHRPIPAPDTSEDGFHLLCTLFGIAQTLCVATAPAGPTLGYEWDSARREHTVLVPTDMHLQQLPLDTVLVLVAAMKVLELEMFDTPEGAIAYLYRSPSALVPLLPETAQPLVPPLTQILHRRRTLLLTQLQRELESPEPEASNPGGPTPVLDSEMLALSLLTLPAMYR
jgi:hypothetical protein